MGHHLTGEVREERGFLVLSWRGSGGPWDRGVMSQSLLRKKQTIKESGMLS